MRFAALSLTLWLVTASSTQAEGLTQPSYVIVPAERESGKDGLEPFWTPSQDEAAQGIAFLQAYVEDYHGAGLKPFDQYRMQVMGKTAAIGNKYPGLLGERAKLIMIGGFCVKGTLGAVDLSKGEVIVFDGGNCFFRAYIDLANRRMAWLSVNGAY